MHPLLDRKQNESECKDIIAIFKSCHEKNPWKKFLGVCNDEKTKLDQCFRIEKEKSRQANPKRETQYSKRTIYRNFRAAQEKEAE